MMMIVPIMVKIRTKIGYARYGRTSSQATESGNSVGKGPSPTGFGYACFKHPVLALVTKANWSTAKLKLFLESRSWKNWDKEITPYAYNHWKRVVSSAAKYVQVQPGTTSSVRVGKTITVGEEINTYERYHGTAES